MLFGLAWLRLRAISVTSIASAPEPALAEPAFAGGGVGAAMIAELRRILNDRGVFGLIVLAPILYGVLYPQPYLGQLLREIPIAVVDQDHTELSRDLVQTLNADEAITVAVRADTLADAHAALARREVFGIVDIPEGHRTRGAEGQQGPHRRLCRFGLFPSLQPHAARHLGSERHGERRRSRSAERESTAASPTRL